MMATRKRMICLLLCIMMLVYLVACGTAASSQPASGPEQAELSEPPELPAAQENEEPSDSGAEILLSDIDVQLGMIHSMLGELLPDDSGQVWYYSVTDLDHDGNLEFIEASQHPEDRSSNLRVLEIGEDRNSLVECRLVIEEDESFPDLMTDSADTYYVAESDTWYYLFYDNVILSPNEVYTSLSAFNLKDGAVSYESFAVEHTVVENGARKVSHTDAEGNEILPEQYTAAGVLAFDGADRSSTSFEWLTAEEVNDLHRLTESYAVFAGQMKATEYFPVPRPEAFDYPEALPEPELTPEPVLTPVPVPTPTPTPAPVFLSITKNPTNEVNRRVGGNASFVACANYFDSLEWTLVSPTGELYTPQAFISLFLGSTISGTYSTTLSFSNLAPGMNGWGAYCTFNYQGQTARTTTAYIYLFSDNQPSPASQVGYGTVYEWNYSCVSVMLNNGISIAADWKVCNLNGEIYVGAPATVYWQGEVGNVTLCSIEGARPIPQPVYGSMSGIAHHDTAFTVYIELSNGTGMHISGSLVNILSGSDIEGASCIVYYTDYPSVDTVYQVDIYAR